MEYDDFEQDYDDREPIAVGKFVVGLISLLCVAGLGYLIFFDGSDDPRATAVIGQVDSVSSTSAADANSPGSETGSGSETETEGAGAGAGAGAGEADPSTSTAPVSGTASDEVAPDADSADDASTTPPVAATDPAAPPAPAPPAPAVITYPTLPDGSPRPVIGIFDTDSITLTGVVHSEDAAIRLETLSRATSKFPDATLINLLTIDPTIPQSVGVRVLELNSVRFPEGSSEIGAEHAIELARAIRVLELFPNASVDVIGHADQRGDPDTNFRLSEDRARAVTSFMVEQGIAPERLAARAVGADDLLTTGISDSSLALNRRTEFIFYGLLLDEPGNEDSEN